MILLYALLGWSLALFEDTPKYLNSFSVYAETPQINYQLVELGEKRKQLSKLQYRPVVNSFQGMSFATPYFSVGYGFQVENKKNEDLKASNLYDFQIYDYLGNFIWEVYYQDYEGLYISEDKILTTTNLPLADSTSYGLELRYFTDKSFSAEESFSNFSNNKKTNWSMAYGGYLDFSELSSSEGLIPQDYETVFNQLVGLKSIQSMALGAEVGYGGLYKYKSFFFSAYGALGIALQSQRFKGIDQEDRVVSGGGIKAFIEPGFDGKWGSISLAIKASGYAIPVKNTQFERTRSVVALNYKHFY